MLRPQTGDEVSQFVADRVLQVFSCMGADKYPGQFYSSVAMRLAEDALGAR